MANDNFPEIGTVLAYTRYYYGEIREYSEVTVTRVLKRYFETSDGKKWTTGQVFFGDMVYPHYPRDSYENGRLTAVTPELKAAVALAQAGANVRTMLSRLDTMAKRRELTDAQIEALAQVLPGILEIKD